MKKIISEKKTIFFICFSLLFLMAMEFIMCPFFIRKKEYPPHQILHQDEIFGVYNYEINGNYFKVTGIDPQFVVPDYLQASTEEIEIEFEKKLEKDTQIQIFYTESSGFCEANSQILTLEEGRKTYNLELKPGNYKHLRLDINGDFWFKELRIHGYVIYEPPARIILFVFMSLIADIGAVYFLSRKNAALATRVLAMLKRGVVNVISFWRIEKFFVLFALIMGTVLSIMIPIGNIPDEPKAHFNWMVGAFGIEGIQEQYGQFQLDITKNDSVLFGARQDFGTWIEGWKVFFDYSKVSFNGDISLQKILWYFPASIGFFIGFILHLPIMGCLQLMEFTALLFYVLIGYVALKLMPLKKELFCMVMLLPMTLQQCGSVSYDAVLLPLCFLLLAIIFNCKYKRENVGWKEVGIILGLTLLIAIIKIPYALIIFICLAIPKEKIHLKAGKWQVSDFIFRHRWIFLIIGISIGIFSLKFLLAGTYTNILRAFLSEPARSGYLLVNTFKADKNWWLNSLIAGFGWTFTSPKAWYIWMTVAVAFVLAQVEDGKYTLKTRTKLFLGIVFGTIFILCIIAMFPHSLLIAGTTTYQYNDITWIREKLYEISGIVGVQGRYFIPIIFLLPLLFSNIIKIKRKQCLVLQFAYYSVYIVCIISLLLHRYWIA